MGKKQVDPGPLGRRAPLKKKIHTSKYTIRWNNFDIQAFEGLVKNNDKLRHELHEGLDDYPQYKELLQDTFDSLFKYNPDLLPDYEVIPNYLLNKALMGALKEHPKYKELRTLTKMNTINSAIGTEILATQLKELLENAKEQRDALKSLVESMSKVAEEEKKDGDSDGPGVDNTQHTLEEAKKILEEAEQKFEDLLKEKEFTHNIHSAISATQEEVQETDEFITHWGLGSDPNYIKKSYKEKMQVLDKLRNSTKLREIAKWVGRYRALAMQRQQSKIKKGAAEYYSIKQGKDLTKMLPTELMKLSHPLTKRLFYKDYMEGRTLQYESREREKECKGPIVMCLDESYSMSGDKEIYMKAMAMGVLEIAIAQKRDFVAIHFSGGSNPKQLKVHYFKKDDPYDIEKIIDFCEYFDAGGTLFEPPLARAKMIIEEDQKFTTADIIFLTDGESAISDKFKDDFNAWTKEKKVTVYSILTDTGYCSTITLKEFTKKENIFKLSDLSTDTKDGIATIIFDSL
jgi:uncharacterized protein with von Willebrand factor type A (vWA) domain